MTTVKWMRTTGSDVLHASVRRRDDQYEQLCMAQQDENPNVVHEVGSSRYCGDCARRALELD